MKDIFLSHTWKLDEDGRNTHSRVRNLSNALTDRGWSTWFDEKDLCSGNIDVAMANGIEQSRVFLVCITKKYIEKVNYGLSNMAHRDNCAKEWSCAMARRKIMIPVILEPSMLDTLDWPSGVVPLHLGTCLFIDATGDDWKEYATNLDKMIHSLGIHKQLSTLPKRRMSFRLPPLKKNTDNNKSVNNKSVNNKLDNNKPIILDDQYTPRYNMGCMQLKYRRRNMIRA